MNENMEGTENCQPPLLCAECKLGHFAVYGPTLDTTPEDIYTRRRDVLTIQAGKTFLREGEPIQLLFTLFSGWAFKFKQMPDGRRQILSFLIPGDAIVLESLFFPGLPMPFSVKSLTQIAMCSFDLEEMVALTRRGRSQSQKLATAMHQQVASVNERLVDLGRKSALGRISQFIIQLEQRLSNRRLSVRGRFDFPIRQEHLADALGLTTVYVNRTLDRLRRLDIIQFDRNCMTVRNIDALREIAEFE
jgi:CRP-like cAMP-binding protein